MCVCVGGKRGLQDMALRVDHNYPCIFVQNAFSFSFPCRKPHVIEKTSGVLVGF